MQIDEIDILFDYICNVSKKKIMIDVGACRGVTLKPFLLASWEVYAFEPDKNNYVYLEKLKKEFSNLKIFKNAVSDMIESDVPFYTSDVSPGISGLHNFHSTHKETNKVDTTTLKKFSEDHNIKEIDFIKIDTEGSDLFVLKGIPWDKIKPKVIICEFEDRKTNALGYNYKNMADYLIKQGYKLLISEWKPIVEYGIKHNWSAFKKYPCELDNINAWGNLIAFNKDINYEKLLNSIIKSYDKQIIKMNNTPYNKIKRKIKKILRIK